MSEISDELLTEAIDRVARSPDGRLLYLFLQRRLMATSLSTDPGTLQRSEGERSFASKLIGLMAKGMAESGGRTSNSSGTPSGNAEQPIVFAVPKPRPTGGDSRGAGRRITADTRVPGYDSPDDPA